MRIYAFDFDGVLCDSSRELFVSAVDTYSALRPASRLVPVLAPVRNDALSGGDLFRDDPMYRIFTDLLPLGNRAEDFGVALSSIDDDTAIPDQSEYDAYFESLDPAWRNEFHQRFYDMREKVRASDTDRWLGLHLPYPELVRALEQRRGRIRPAVATAKDAVSIGMLLAELGLAQVFDPSLILDKETGVEKTNHLRELQRLTGVPFPEITFIDDKVNHLVTVSELGVRTVLAGWGFNSERELDLAHRIGFEIAQLHDLDTTLFKGE